MEPRFNGMKLHVDMHIRFWKLFVSSQMKSMISFIFIYGGLTINLKSHFYTMETTIMGIVQYPYTKNILYTFEFFCTLENVNSQVLHNR